VTPTAQDRDQRLEESQEGERRDHPGPDLRIKLTAEALGEQSWEYGPADSSVIWGSMRFAPESVPQAVAGARGRIFGFNHPNERRWRLANGVLTLFNDDRVATSRFDWCGIMDDRLTLRGPHLKNDGGLHQLQAVVPLTAWPQETARLAIEERFTDLSRPLVVLFNSMGHPLGESGTARWEYYRFTADPGIDYLRFAEPLKPAAWYLRTDAQVRQALARAAAGRQRVILAGNSSGGYAAIRFGQWMADAGLAPEIRTIAVNPQTAHSLPHRLHLWARDWDHFIPNTIDDDVLKLTGRTDVDLGPLLAAGRRRFAQVRHLVFYDSDNPVEAYYVGLISGQPGVRLHGLPLGMPHARGINEMEHRGVMRKALREAVDAPPSWRARFAQRLPSRARELLLGPRPVAGGFA
jgi:hypothetical protein